MYARRPPRLLALNTDAWAVLELCDGRDVGAAERDFADLVGDDLHREDCRARFLAALSALQANGLIGLIANSPPKPSAEISNDAT